MGDDLRGASQDVQLLEAWHTNNRINLVLIDGISDEGLRSSLSTRGGRDVARQFAHLHNVRVYQMEQRAKDLAEALVIVYLTPVPIPINLLVWNHLCCSRDRARPPCLARP